MKRIFLGATAFVALLFSSCEKNDNASADLTGA
jgi:lipoprotein